MIEEWLESAWTELHPVVSLVAFLGAALLVLLGVAMAFLWRRMRQLQQQVDVLLRRIDEQGFDAEDTADILEWIRNYAKSIPKLDLKVTHQSSSQEEMPT